MVERQHREADDHGEKGFDAPEQERRRGFLGGEDIEEAVDELGAATLFEGGCRHFGDTRADRGDEADEESPLHHFDDPGLERAQRSGEHETGAEERGQDDDRLYQRAKRDRAHQDLGRHRRRQRQDSDACGIDGDRTDVAILVGEEVVGPRPGRDVVSLPRRERDRGGDPQHLACGRRAQSVRERAERDPDGRLPDAGHAGATIRDAVDRQRELLLVENEERTPRPHRLERHVDRSLEHLDDVAGVRQVLAKGGPSRFCLVLGSRPGVSCWRQEGFFGECVHCGKGTDELGRPIAQALL